MKEGSTFGLLAVMPDQKKRLWGLKQWSLKENAMIFYQILSTNSLSKRVEISLDNLNVDIEAEGVNSTVYAFVDGAQKWYLWSSAIHVEKHLT